jgi:hypothetical protein
MANEIHYIDTPGQTSIYCLLVNKVGKVRNITLNNWDNLPQSSDWQDCCIAMVNQNNTPFYYASIPAGIDDDIIEVYVFKKLGSNRSPTDTYLGTGVFKGWDGSSEISLVALRNEGAIGPGSLNKTFVIRDTDSTPLGNVKCWISTDIAGSNVIAGSLLTDYLGKVTFLLDPGTYYLWRSSPYYTFHNPQQFTVL